jgi:hypothetical protein
VRKGLTVVLIALAMMYSAPAKASSVSMTLTGVGSGDALGGVYIGPYVASIDGVPNFNVICDDYTADSYVGESWYANTSTLADVSATKFKDLTGYEELAWLASKLVDSSSACPNVADCAGDIQYAMWQVFDSVGSNTPFSHLSGANLANAQYWLSQAQSQTFTPSQFSNFVIYTPTSCITGLPCSTNSLPQEFVAIRSVPEPGSMLLLAMGAVSLIGYRKRLVVRA